MKFTKRLLVALLALSILAAGLAFMASAEGSYTFTAEGIEDIEDILEFYEYGDPIVNDLAGEDTVGHDSYEGAPLEKVGTDEEWTTSVSIPGASASGYTVAVNKDKLVFEFSVKFSGAEGTAAIPNLVYELRAKLANEDLIDATTTSLFQADLVSATPAFKYSVWDEEAGAFSADTVALEGITPAADKWYKVVLYFNGEQGTYSFEIAEEGKAAVASPELSLGDKTSMAMFQLRGEFQRYSYDALNVKAAFSVKDVEIYGGTKVRNIDNKDAITSDALADLGKIYKDANTTEADKVRVAEVINTLQQYLDEDKINGDIGLEDDVDTMFNYSYAQAVILAVEAINTDDNYRERMDHVAKIDRYNEFVKDVAADTPGLNAELFASLETARAALAEEKAALVVVHDQTLAFIEYMAGYEQVSATDYDGSIAAFYTAAMTQYPEMDLEYCEADGDVGTVIDNWNVIVSKVDYYETTLAAFKGYNAILNVEKTADNFGDRYYDGYLPAKDLYAEIKDNSFFDYTTAKALVDEIAIYSLEANAPYMAAEEKKCLDFIQYVSEASVSTYYSVLAERLALAEPLYAEVQEDFEGIVDSKAVYDSLVEANEADVLLAQAYIAKVAEAVAKLADENADFAAKKAAVEAAVAAKADGNLFGYAGIMEANVDLSEAQTVILALEGNSKTLVALVAQLDTVTSLTERRTILRNAVAASKGCEKTYKGVSDALTKLDAAVAEFTAAVDGANGALTAAVENAVSVAAGAVTDANVYKTASIIKDHAK